MTKSRLNSILIIGVALSTFGCGGASGLGDGAPDLDGGTCGRSAPTFDPSDQLASYRYGLVARWRGTATTPPGWVPASPYDVEITFAADGTYTANALAPAGALPFYYDQNPESDRYELLSVEPEGASGNLYLQWLGTPDQISSVRFDPQWQTLHFEFTHAGAGPVVYDLTCK